MLKEVYGFAKLQELSYDTAAPPDVAGFLLRQNSGPSEERPLVDMRADLDSPWNKRVVEILLRKIQTREDAARIGLAEFQWRNGIKDRLRNAKGQWKQAQPRVDPATGIAGTPVDLGARVLQNEREELARHRRDSRRNTVSAWSCS